MLEQILSKKIVTIILEIKRNFGKMYKMFCQIRKVMEAKLTDLGSGSQITEETTASYINDFFVNIGPNLARNCNSDWTFRGNNCRNSIDIIRTNIDEITKLCKKLTSIRHHVLKIFLVKYYVTPFCQFLKM